MASTIPLTNDGIAVLCRVFVQSRIGAPDDPDTSGALVAKGVEPEKRMMIHVFGSVSQECPW
jgi:hypothetical protein